MQAINARVELINGQFNIPDDAVEYVKLVREAISEAARKIRDGLPKTFDVGRIVAGMDKLQEARDTLCAASILPHAHR